MASPSVASGVVKIRLRTGSRSGLKRLPVLALATVLLAGALPARAQYTYEVLHAFEAPPQYPEAGLIRGSDGAFYGTTPQGGAFSYGAVFKVSEDGSGFTILHSFDYTDGAYTFAGLVSSGGVLYGTMRVGGANGYGTVFRIGEDGSGFSTLHDFDNTDGANPHTALVSSGGFLYGTTFSSAGPDYGGTVFRIGEDGSGFSTLHVFHRTDGANPLAPLISSGGVLYGTTLMGGPSPNSNPGTVFKIGEDGTGFAVLHYFAGSEGTNPQGAVLLSGSVLYGTTGSSGASGYGSVFKVGQDGSGFTVLHHFDNTSPRAALVSSGGVLYGTTISGDTAVYGNVFRIGQDGSGFAIVHTFDNVGGASPWAPLVISGGFLYGTTAAGGSAGNVTDGYGGYGVIFKMKGDGSAFTIVHNFSNTNSVYPRAALLSSGSFLYGTTALGGNHGSGTVFKIGEDGSGFTILHSFDNTSGANPRASLITSGGVLYGTTLKGGTSDYGTVFKIGEDGSGFTVLHNFDSMEGANPYAALVSSGGLLFGTTVYGGTTGIGGAGTIFQIGEDGSGFTVLHNFEFKPTDGARPVAALVSSGGALYGTTVSGGTSPNGGSLFRIGEDGSGFTVLHNFESGPSMNGAAPRAALVSSAGVLYGATTYGGLGYGTAFRIGEDGSGFSILHHFHATDGAYPEAPFVRADGLLYGTAGAPEDGKSGYGTVFQVGEDGSEFAILHSFDNSDGAFPYGGLVRSGSVLYGTTASGGPNGGGVVFRLVPPPVTLRPSSLTFGSQAVFSSSAAQTVIVKNSSSTTLVIASVTIVGANPTDFALSSNTCDSPLLAEEKCALGIIFTPTASGDRTAAVSIADDADGSPHLIALSGTGADTVPPTVSLVAPNGGERVFTRTPYIIRWTASDNVGVTSVDVAFSPNAGVSFSPVPGCTGLAGTAQSCTWASPGPVTTRGRIRVTAHDGAGLTGAATSSANFAVRAGTAVLTLTVPTAAWRIANTQSITFNHDLGVGATVIIDLSRDGGATWTTLNPAFVTTSATTGRFAWVVTGPTTTNARARVRWAGNPAVTSMSRVSFPIVDRISLTAPNTAVTWAIGSRHSIRWSHNLGISEAVNIDVSRDGGSTWSSVATNVANGTATTGTYSWIVSAPASTATRMRVSWSTQPSVSSISAVSFGVSGRITATAPTGNWAIGTNREITWQHNLGPGQSFDIDLSTDGGRTFPTSIASSVAAGSTSGSYSWVVAGPASANARIRVRGPASSAASGTTVAFRMVAPATTVKSPNTAVRWINGTTRAITWSHNLGTQESVNIYESSDGGLTWAPIAASVPNTTVTTGTFSWLVAAPVSTRSRIRVSWADDETVTGQSAVNFTVANPVPVTSPGVLGAHRP